LSKELSTFIILKIKGTVILWKIYCPDLNSIACKKLKPTGSHF
jgi:hypothetical protein